MASSSAAWGIEVGANAIKAIRLERDGDNVEVSNFAVIPHRKVLSTPDLDQDEVIRLGLGQFISQHTLENEHLVMSVPGHAAFARFAKLPPVEMKKVPDIVKFEAVQQIPFPIDEVEWDYQTFTDPDSPEVEVGIFAITRERVQQRLNLYGELGISPEMLTLSPVAVHNAMVYDRGAHDQGPVLYLDIGTQATDVIIVEGDRCWIRTFPLGGTHFTEAIANAFKLSYSKAEKLKLEAATSKYAKQIMQAMRPVFSDLLQDLQRSIGYYSSVHKDKELNHMVGLGSTFKIPGLRKFLGQQLQINVTRLDEFRRIAVTGREAASFSEHTVTFATAYGLALQGVGLGSIDVNLMPVQTLRHQVWQAKTKWFGAAAAIVVIGSAMTLYRPYTDGAALNPGGPPAIVNSAVEVGQNFKSEFTTLQSQAQVGAKASNMFSLLDYRDIWPHLLADSAAALHAADPQPALLGDDLQAMSEIPPAERRLISLRHLTGSYAPSGDPKQPGFIDVTMHVEFSHADPIQFINDTVLDWLRENADRPGAPYTIVVDSISGNPEALEVLEVTEDGERVTDPGSAPRFRPPDSPGGPPRSPRVGGGNTGGAGGLPGRRLPGEGGGARPPSAPSPRTPGMPRPGGGPTPPSTPPGDTPAGHSGWRGGDGGSDAGGANLAELAPIPEAPRTLPVGSTFYRLPVTFRVQLRSADHQTAGQDGSTASAAPIPGQESPRS